MSPKEQPPRRDAAFYTDKYGRGWWPRLEQHMSIDKLSFIHYIDYSSLDLSGSLKPQPNEGGGSAVRHMFMDVLDQVLAELADLGATHIRHPDVRITGGVERTPGKPDDFSYLRCEVFFDLLVKH